MDNTLSLHNLFHERIFRIPDYQRGYAWEEEQVNDLLEDLELLNASSRHYAGTIVLCKRPDEPMKMGSDGTPCVMHAVVDGQQRLTTIVLLLNELSRVLDAYPECADLAQGIRKNYVEAKSSDDAPIYKLSLDKSADHFFKTSILSDTPGAEPPRVRSAARLRDAKEQIAGYFQRDDEHNESEEEHRQMLVEWHRKLTQQLHFNLYEVEKEADVGIIFEVMNDRGKALTELEKVKNYLLYASRSLDVEESSSDELADAVNEAWAVILENLMAAGLGSPGFEDQLLQMHWIVKYEPQAKKWDGVKSVKGKFRLSRHSGQHAKLLGDLREYVEGLRDSSVAYCDARNPRGDGAFASFPEDARDGLKYWNAKLLRIGVIRTFLPLLMAARQRWPKEPEKYVELVKLCETFAFRAYSVWGARSHYRESAMFHLAHAAAAHRLDFVEAVREMKNSYGSREARRGFDEFMDATDTWPLYEWSGLRYFLYEYEEHLATERSAPPKISWQEVTRVGLKDTIEHVLPQGIGRQPYWQERFTAAEHKEYVHDIGNLALTKWNSYHSDKPFPEKKGEFGAKTADGEELRCYANAPLFQEQEVAQYADWTKESIDARRAKLFAWARDRWAVDFSDVDGAGAEYVAPDDDGVASDEVEETEEGDDEA